METNDLTAKNFETYPDVAADIINVLIYEGEQKIDKDSLLASPTETVYQGREKLRNQLEDVARYEIHDGRVTMQYLFANQTRRDSKMIFRKAGYIGSAYREQYDGKVKDVYPVVEIVLYWCLLASGNVFSKKVWLSDSNQRIWKRQRKDRKTTENRGKGTSFNGENYCCLAELCRIISLLSCIFMDCDYRFAANGTRHTMPFAGGRSPVL